MTDPNDPTSVAVREVDPTELGWSITIFDPGHLVN